jgi:hypothetical protein
MPSKVDLSHIKDPKKIKRVSGRLVADTPIQYMGIDADAASQLTPAAANITKADLEALGGPNSHGIASRLGLKVDDINSIKNAFQEPLYFGGVGGGAPQGTTPALSTVSVSCCCCTPCCCAAAALETVGPAA